MSAIGSASCSTPTVVGYRTVETLRWTPLSGQRWGGVKRESRRVPLRRSAAERVERLGRLPSPFQ